MIPTAIDHLSTAEKLRLVWELWDSISEDQQHIPLSQTNKLEIQRTLDDYRLTGNKGDTWDVVKARILGVR
jgi:putative addiction module component (TIGR02574 family)